MHMAPPEPAPRVRANDYCQHFVDTGERPQNFIRDTELADRFEEFPAKRELMERKARRGAQPQAHARRGWASAARTRVQLRVRPNARCPPARNRRPSSARAPRRPPTCAATCAASR
jgi:hypothetical protein